MRLCTESGGKRHQSGENSRGQTAPSPARATHSREPRERTPNQLRGRTLSPTCVHPRSLADNERGPFRPEVMMVVIDTAPRNVECYLPASNLSKITPRDAPMGKNEQQDCSISPTGSPKPATGPVSIHPKENLRRKAKMDDSWRAKNFRQPLARTLEPGTLPEICRRNSLRRRGRNAFDRSFRALSPDRHSG